MATKRTPVTEDHEQTETLKTDVIEPGHETRGAATPLFKRTRLALIQREQGKCWLSGLTAKELGPLEAHHWPVERCWAERWDWPRFAKAAQSGKFGPGPQGFDWTDFFKGGVTITAPDTGKPFCKVRDPYLFVDNMLVNGRLLGKQFHVHVDAGAHNLTESQWLAQGFLAEGYKFSPTEVIHHDFDATET
jgi:hypothetical protein